MCDATCVTVITGNGAARPGCLRVDGGALRRAERDNNRTYPEVNQSRLGRLCCLGVEVFGRWSSDPLDIVPALARERAQGLPRRGRRGTELAFLHRWWGLCSGAVQRLVAETTLRDSGEDLVASALEPVPALADLPVATE